MRNRHNCKVSYKLCVLCCRSPVWSESGFRTTKTPLPRPGQNAGMYVSNIHRLRTVTLSVSTAALQHTESYTCSTYTYHNNDLNTHTHTHTHTPYQVEYDLERSTPDNLRLLSTDRIEQSAVPLSLTWYPPVSKESFLLLSNDRFKLRLLNSTTKMCRKMLLGPTFGSPLRKSAGFSIITRANALRASTSAKYQWIKRGYIDCSTQLSNTYVLHVGWRSCHHR